jgi:hypothetical protein
MSAAPQQPSVILPVLLAVIGVAALATAVMLVPLIVRTSLAQIQPATPLAAREPPVGDAPQQIPEPSPPQPAPAGTDQKQTAADAGAPVESVAWTLTLDPKSYALDDASSAALDAIVRHLYAHPKNKVALTGVNNPMRSSKRAKQAARRVKETLVESGVERYRITANGVQEEGAKGLVVRAEIPGEEQ